LYFQINDDFINLTDQDYWRLKGFCDDFDEQKYSYPVVIFYETVKNLEKKSKFDSIFYKENKTDSEKQELLNILESEDVFNVVRSDLEDHKQKIQEITSKLSILNREQYTELCGIMRVIVK